MEIVSGVILKYSIPLLLAGLIAESCRSGSGMKESDLNPDRIIAPLSVAKEVSDLSEYVEEVVTCRIGDADLFTMPPMKFLQDEKTFFFVHGGTVYALSKDGVSFRTIGKRGRGPGEYLGIIDICLDVTGQEILCLSIYGDGIFRYEKNSGRFLGKVEITEPPGSPEGIMPVEGGGFFVYYPGSESGTDYASEEPFYCLWQYDRSGSVVSKSLRRTDFNLSAAFFSPVTQLDRDSYLLVPQASLSRSPLIERGRMKSVWMFDLGKEGLPPQYALREKEDPWRLVGDIFDSDYYKLVHGVYLTKNVLHVSFFGAGGMGWNAEISRDGETGIMWKSVLGNAVASDEEYLYFALPAYTNLPAESADDVLVLYLKGLGILSESSDEWSLIKLKIRVE